MQNLYIQKRIYALFLYILTQVIIVLMFIPFYIYSVPHNKIIKLLNTNFNFNLKIFTPNGYHYSCLLFKLLSGYKQEITKDADIIKEGYIFPNHQSFTDFALDAWYTDAAFVSRLLAIIAAPASLLCHLDNKLVPIDRTSGSDNIFDKIKNHMKEKHNKVIVYIEGTRCKYSHIDVDTFKDKYLKYGILKKIYKSGDYPIQIFYTSGKNNIFDEKTFIHTRGVFIKSHLSKPLYPKDYKSFEKFVIAVCELWVYCHNKTQISLL
jgi:1-acyl-sn-glycerol-3-phosphate acyltransferase